HCILLQIAAKYPKELEPDAMSWIEAVYGQSVAWGSGDEARLGDHISKPLTDGVILSKIVNKLFPGSIKKIHEEKPNSFKMQENISNFLAACEKNGVDRVHIFQTVDLYEKQNIGQVISCLQALSRVNALTRHGHRTARSPHGHRTARHGHRTVTAQYGTVTAQYGTVTAQYGTVIARHGTVTAQYGTVDTAQYGTVTARHGTVTARHGTARSPHGHCTVRHGHCTVRHGHGTARSPHGHRTVTARSLHSTARSLHSTARSPHDMARSLHSTARSLHGTNRTIAASHSYENDSITYSCHIAHRKSIAMLTANKKDASFPLFGPKQADEHKREFTEEQLREAAMKAH
ncbi:hypothetical protein QZH41_016018, partial [Actinostola sp. cb2023]